MGRNYWRGRGRVPAGQTAVIYILGAFAIVAALSGLYGAWEHKGKVAAEAQVAELGAKIEQQNQAILQVKAEGDRRVAEASKGVQNAARATQAARSEAERLRTLQNAPSPSSSCPAATAVAELRKGLK